MLTLSPFTYTYLRLDQVIKVIIYIWFLVGFRPNLALAHNLQRHPTRPIAQTRGSPMSQIHQTMLTGCCEISENPQTVYAFSVLPSAHDWLRHPTHQQNKQLLAKMTQTHRTNLTGFFTMLENHQTVFVFSALPSTHDLTKHPNRRFEQKRGGPNVTNTSTDAHRIFRNIWKAP